MSPFPPRFGHSGDLTSVNVWGLEGNQGDTMAREHPSVPDGVGNSLRGLHAARSGDREPPHKAPKTRRSGLRVTLIAAAVWLVLVGGILIAHWFSDLPNTSNLFAYEPGNDISV